MNWFGEIREQPWRITIAAVGGLLVAIIIAGLVGFLLNQNIERAADETKYDVSLEDEGDDLRAAVLDVRHYHRNIYFSAYFSEVHSSSIEDFQDARQRMYHEINELEDVGVKNPDLTQPEEIRKMADVYYRDFNPAIKLAETDRAAFEEASDQGLMRIEEMESAATEIDERSEDLSEHALGEVDRAATTATLVLLAVIGGLVLAGAVLAYAAVRVVNELRRLYAEQQATAEKLAEASQAKSDFIADVSHELRTPLTVLRGNAEVGLQLGRDGLHGEILEDILAESGRMTRMVEDLLFLARSDSAEVPFEPGQVYVASLLEDIAGRAETLVRERGANLEAKLSGEGELEADARRLEQAVLILADNAAKYGPPGGRVRLTSATEAGKLRIEVADEGPGIPEKDLPHVFERFYRVDKTRSRKLGGAGLGLPIARTIVEAHGGSIEAESRAGEGTRMTIRLPLIESPQPSARTKSR